MGLYQNWYTIKRMSERELTSIHKYNMGLVNTTRFSFCLPPTSKRKSHQCSNSVWAPIRSELQFGLKLQLQNVNHTNALIRPETPIDNAPLSCEFLSLAQVNSLRCHSSKGRGRGLLLQSASNYGIVWDERVRNRSTQSRVLCASFDEEKNIFLSKASLPGRDTWDDVCWFQ